MNDNYSTDIKEAEFPKGLHSRILKNLFFLKTKGLFLVTEFFLVLGLILSGWHLWVRLNELQTFPIIAALFEGFSLSSDFLSNFAENFENFVPFVSTMVFLVNIVAIIYLAYIYHKFSGLKTIEK